MSHRFEVVQLKVGYSSTTETGAQIADGSVTLVNERDGSLVVLVDTGGPWGKDSLLQALGDNNVTASDVSHVIGTHGHSDHIGNLNLFPDATFIVSYDINKRNQYFDNDLGKGEAYVISEQLRVIPTPGHTGNDVSLVVEDTQLGTVIVAGDLFECEDDLEKPEIWREVSQFPEKQKENRAKVLKMADYIVPGHGKMFAVKKT